MKRSILILFFALLLIIQLVSAENFNVGVSLSPPESEVTLSIGEESEVELFQKFDVKYFDFHEDNAFIIVSDPDSDIKRHVVLGTGDSQEIDVTDDGYDDLNVILIYLNETTVSMIIQDISEDIEPLLSPGSVYDESLSWLWWLIGVAIILVIITEYFVLKKR